MAQPPQFRPGGPGGPPPPGPPGGPPGAHGPPGPPGGPPGAPGRTSFPPGSRPGSFEPPPHQPLLPPPVLEQSGKGRKGKRRRGFEDSDEEEDECKCPPQQPATQIFICPPGSQPPGMGMGMGMGGPQGMGMGPEFGGGNDRIGGMPPMGNHHNSFIDPAKLCQIQCYGGDKSQDTQTQVMCCPPSNCYGCQKKGQRQRNQGPGGYQGWDQEGPPKKSKKPQAGTMEGMMPASQQFLMFLQAYGLAAALIRDRNRREDERQQKEFEHGKDKDDKDEKDGKDKKKRHSSASKDRKSSAKSKGKDKDKKKKEKA